ncbi:MAG: YciI family protein [Burkholderiaceae bacterium]
MHIIKLHFSARKVDAPQWMAAHNAWLDAGFSDGVFLAAGSLEDGSGGCILAAQQTRDLVEARVAQDPFVMHGVVTPEITSFKPGRTQPALASLLTQTPA